MIATSQFTISVINDGAPGATGPQGVSVTKVVEEYRLSNSNTELTGSGTGYSWSETKPDIPSGKYLWIRERTDLSNNTSSYSTAHCDIVISGLVQDVDRNSGVITSKVWESYTQNSINEYDGSTGAAIRDRVTQTETDISGINSTISDIQTNVANKADGSTVQTLTTRVNTISDTVDGHTQTISSNTSRIDDAEDEIESTKTVANQTADKFTWLVQSGTSSSNFTLTSRVAELISPQVVIKDPAGSATIISGGKIHANAITTAMLATDAIKSTNYQASTSASSPYSATGAFLDLNTGSLYMPNFGVNGTTGAAYFNGTVNANAGKFGDNTSYWNIETVYDYNMQPHAALVGTGSPYLQTGNWQVSDNAVATRKYTSTSESAGNATYYKDSDSNTFYDVGMKIPTNFGGYSASDSSVTRYNKAFYYGRKYTGNNIPSLDSDWTYFFSIDSGGNVITAGDVYEGGVKLSEKYAAITDVGSAYLPKTGGTITGNLSVNGSFTTNLMLQTNLGSTSAGQLTGNANATVTHGVTGTLGVGNGGTGKSSWTANRLIYSSASNALSELGAGTSGQVLKSNGSSAPSWVNQSTLSVGSATKATQDGDGNVITDTYRALDDNQFDTIDITDAQVGNLMVTGAGRFTNGLYGDLIGNADTATTATTANKVANNLKIQIDSGTTEGTNQFTYNGSAVKNINITKSSIGLGNVENTKLSTWTGSTSLVQTSVGSLGNAAVKTVDTSISNGSVSTNLPTSAAVVNYVSTYVSNQGFVTSSGVTSVRVQATSPVVSSTNTAQTSTLNTTISLADAYGDTKNPYGNKTANYVLAGPSSGSVAAPSFRALVADDIPTLSSSKVGLGNVTNNKQVKGLSSGTTSGHLVTWGSDGYTVADSGIAKTGVATKLTLAGTDYSVSSNTITVTQANLQSAVQSTSLVLMTSDERAKLSSIQVSEGGTIDFSGVTASAPLTATVATNKTVNITHNTSGVTAGTYRSVTVNTYGHVTAGTNPTTLSGYGITDAKIASGVITLGNNTITPLTASSTLDATKLSGTASISTTGNATTATKFSSNRTIALTGDVTGSVSGTGENGWSITTTVGDNSHNHDSSTIVPIATKTYTGWLGTADNNAANDSFYFMKLRPTDYYAQWRIRYRVTATIPNQNNYHATSDVTLCGYGQASAPAYSIFNTIYSTSYRPYYYHNFYRLTSTGYNANLSNAIGLGLRSSNSRNTTGYERTVKIEILETFNCSFELLDSGVKWANWENNTSTNYAGLSEYDGYNNGLKESGDDNDIVTQRAAYTRFTAGSGGMKQYSLIMEDANGTWQSFTTTNGTGTSKTKNLTGFKLGRLYYFNTSGNIAEGAVNGNNIVEERHQLIDIRYSINSGQTLVGYQPLWIVGIINNGLFYLDDPWWTQTAPTNADGKIYIPLGVVNPESNINAGYRIDFMGWQGAYYFDGTNFIQYVEAAKAVSATKATQDASGNTISSTYAKLSGATFTGAVNTANNTWNTIGDDAYLGDINKAGHIGIQGKNGNTGLFFTTYNQSTKTTGGAITWDGSKFTITGTIDTSISGNAGTATSATQDSDGNAINTTYAKLSGATFTGAIKSNAGVYVNATGGGNTGGIGLYSSNAIEDYGIAMRGTSNSGKHGFVQGDWAIYSYMSGTSSANSKERGWILRNRTDSATIASVSGAGHAVFNGSVTVGGNTTNTSGCRQEFDADLQCLNFVFN